MSEEIKVTASDEVVQDAYDAMVSTLLLMGRTPAFQPEEVEALARAASEAALTRAHDGDGWRDIESAPKDGSEVLALTDRGEYDFASWHGDHLCGERFGYVKNGFTHWRPLPAPPQSTLEQERRP